MLIFNLASIKAVSKGLLSFLPGIDLLRRREGGGANSARYCYSVWLRHLTIARRRGMQQIPRVIAELGPGDSLGIGLAALLSGSECYQAFDVVHFIRHDQNLFMLEELLALFRSRSPIPDEHEFPKLYPQLDNYAFPDEILTDQIMRDALSSERVALIRDALDRLSRGEKQTMIYYSVPWNNSDIVQTESVDMIISQAVLEHVDKLCDAYASMYRWLRPGGFISHEIDFKSHGTAQNWNGHWCYGNIVWRMIRGNRPYLLNREPCCTHVDFARESGFSMILVLRQHLSGGFLRGQLPPRFSNVAADDLTTGSAYLLACKVVNEQ